MTKYSDTALYESVESALSLMDCDIGAAECHGMLCGLLCGARHFDASIWLGHATGYQGEINLSDLGAGHALTLLLEDTIAGFSADYFALQVLLPADDHPVAVRADALGSWCRGFLSGFGLGDLAEVAQLSDDSQGFLQDLDKIGRVDAVDLDDRRDEFALMEVCEYTRMGAMLLREETWVTSAVDDGIGTIH